ncbi:MAG: alginate export family protein [Pseudomonadales bacterium]|nr:alginate export family protein [Pseudomonadales bacterium]
MVTQLLRLALVSGFCCLFSGTTAASEQRFAVPADFRFSARLRYEHVSDDLLKDASALSLRSTLSARTTPWNGFTGFAELQNNAVLSQEDFSDGVVNRNTAVIADPDATELNQLWLQYTGVPATRFRLGRQQLVLDNQRFVGNVDFRQNEQTFDAFSVQHKPVSDLTLAWHYLTRVHTVLGEQAPAGDREHHSRLYNLHWNNRATGSVTLYHYDINDQQATERLKTIGMRWQKRIRVDTAAINWALEYAHQRNVNGTGEPAAAYQLAEVGLTWQGLGGALRYEMLGEDNGFGFSTPLATLHGFQGFADRFLSTPGNGLRDMSGKLTFSTGKVQLGLIHHRFRPAAGSGSHGNETDFLLTCSLSDSFDLMVKFADFRGNDFGRQDVRKFWVQLSWTP